MDEMQAAGKCAFHRAIAFMVIVLAGCYVVFFKPFGIRLFEMMLFLITSQFMFYLELIVNLRYSGYGVASEINKLARKRVASDFGGLVWNGLLIKPLVRSWLLSVVGYLVLMLSAEFMLDDKLFEAVLPVMLTYGVARLIALLGEIYVWLMADRHRLWYMPKTHLRDSLQRLKWPEKTIEDVVRQAQERGLLLT